ncbi:sigma-70 family RNA polymerase sigma factor [Dactylosporangium sp. AC04546]|uniref:RNA polymerase sigma factor n=1 Tax=Dactylosporangium sp. AC04546 TaxID=2862460 RepID=UPI001EE10676|nr:sigma-70 family RNA polymerase sigma factor [Dactylosporangium sp. AC04546]WVK88931.1 sigma-70 family RNA polymerase sigma factor [Dactylosporangium sp. AC04546]
MSTGNVNAPTHHAPTPEWFEAFFAAHYGDLVRTAGYALVALGLSDDDAEDMVQEVLLRQLRSGHWDHIDDPLRYFRTAVVYRVKDERGRVNRRPDLFAELPAAAERAASDDIGVWADHQWIEQLFKALTPGQRDVFRLVYEGLGGPEIADRLGKTEATVRATLRNARHRLRRLVPPQTRASANDATTEEPGKERP